MGCLLEKQRTTPDQYPLTLNSLRLACNQSTNRDPVVDYDEATVRRALGELGRRRWIRGASGHTSRSPKYRQLIDTELKLDQDQVAVLAVLMLRGAQTPGELKARCERLFAFHDLAAIHTTLDALIGRDLVERLQRRPGQKEERYRQLLGGGPEGDGGSAEEPAHSGSEADSGPVTGEAIDGAADQEPRASGAAPPRPRVDLPIPVDTPETERIEHLEREVERLKVELTQLREGLAELQEQLGG